MFYDFVITVPAGTTEAAPAILDMKLTKGVIHHVEVKFRDGADWTAFCRIMRGGHQLYPTNQEGAFVADHFPIAFDDSFELDDEPLTLKAVCYSPTSTYPHILNIEISQMDNSTILFLLKVARGLQKMLQLMRIPV